MSGTPPLMFQLMIRMGEYTKAWELLEVRTSIGEQRHYRWWELIPQKAMIWK